MSYSWTGPVFVDDSATVPLSAGNLNSIRGAVEALYADKVDLAGGTFTGAIVVPDITSGANRIRTAAENSVGTDSAHDLVFKTNNVARARFMSTGALRPSTRIERDDNAAYTDRDAWIQYVRNFGTPLTGDDHSVLDVRLNAIQGGTVADRSQGIKVVGVDYPGVANVSVTGATNASPIVVTATAHPFVAGDRVVVWGVGGNTAANGVFIVASPTTNTFALSGTTGNGVYTTPGTVTNRPMYYGIASYVYPRLSRGGITGPGIHGDDVACYVAMNLNGANFKGTDAYYVATAAGAAQSEWTTIFTADCRADYGVRINGHIENYAFDTSAGTQALGAIRLGNAQKIRGRNAANSGDVDMLKLNAANEVEVTPPLRLTDGVRSGVSALPFNPASQTHDYDDFLSSSTSSAAVGKMGWNLHQATSSFQDSDVNHPGIHRITSTAAAGTFGALLLKWNGSFMFTNYFDVTFIVKTVEADTDTRLRIGLMSNMGADPTHGAYFEKLYADTNWYPVSRFNATQTRGTAMTATAAATWYRLRVRKDAAGLSFSINGGTEQLVTGNPQTSGVAIPALHITPQVATAKSVDVDYYEHLVTGMTR